VRINAQLIDATSGHHLWAERYDGRMDDIFALQDKINQKIVTALAVTLKGAEQEQVARKETDNIEAYDAFLKGREHYRRRTQDDFMKAFPYFEKAIELDPNYGDAYAGLAALYLWSNRYQWGGNFYDERKLMNKYSQMAMKNPTALAYWMASQMSLLYHQHEEAIAQAQRSIDIDPNDPDCHVQMAHALTMAGRPKEAVVFVERAMRLDPHFPAYYQYVLGLTHFAMGQLEEAMTLMKSATKRNPNIRDWLLPLASAYANLGHIEEAQTALNEHGHVRPSFKEVWYYYPFKDPKVAHRFTEGLAKAGMK
jgi:tetratricopeptide (TPR) repeat protein